LIATQNSSRSSDASDVNQSREGARILKALIIVPNEKTSDLGSLLAIARSEACKREHVQENPVVRALAFVAELGVYVAVYQVTSRHENGILKK
jgi:hypothetical protein